MAQTYAGDVLYIAGKFKDAQGVEKNRFVKCGAYFDNGGKIGIKLEFIPVGVDPTKGLWFGLYPKKDGNGQQSKPPANNGKPPAPKSNGNEEEYPY